jgi:hypothetical protein
MTQTHRAIWTIKAFFCSGMDKVLIFDKEPDNKDRHRRLSCKTCGSPICAIAKKDAAEGHMYKVMFLLLLLSFI